MGTRDAEMADPSKVLRGANPEYSFGATVANDKVSPTPLNIFAFEATETRSQQI